MPKPTASSAAVPGRAAAAGSPCPCAIWYFTKSFRLPMAAMLDRLSMACSTSGGTETFSTMKLRDLEAVLRGDDRVDQRQQRVAKLGVARRHVEHRDLAPRRSRR